MKLEVKAQRYVLSAAATCPKAETRWCGVQYRA